MQTWPRPVTVKALRGFLGLTGYYRKFVKDYGLISKPLTELLKKDAFTWNAQAKVAFNRLKKAMISTPVLALPDFKLPFEIQVDACDTGIGGVLMQQGKPIAFYSKALGPKYISYSTYERELLAIVLTVSK